MRTTRLTLMSGAAILILPRTSGGAVVSGDPARLPARLELPAVAERHDVSNDSISDDFEKVTDRDVEEVTKRGVEAKTERDDVEMVAVPGGEFLMGSDDPEAAADERPAVRIVIGEFRIDKFEVTNRRYRQCVDAGSCSVPAGGSYYEQAKAEHPATVMSWKQAAAYCQWAGKRLPTEAEWEKAARGGDGRRYPWGDRFEANRANAGYSSGTSVAGSHPGGASPYGAMDMAGNVWEWTSSLYRPGRFSVWSCRRPSICIGPNWTWTWQSSRLSTLSGSRWSAGPGLIVLVSGRAATRPAADGKQWAAAVPKQCRERLSVEESRGE